MAREEIRYDQVLRMVETRRDLLGNPLSDRELRAILGDYRDRFVITSEEHRALMQRLKRQNR